MNEKLNEPSIMPVPDAALRDPRSIEMLRVWIAENKLWCSLRAGYYKERKGPSEGAAWGIILADAAKHIAAAMQLECGDEPLKTLEEIQASFNAECRDPTSEAQGGFV